MKKTFMWLLTIIGALCLVLAVYYWMTPAGNLATFLPGYEPGIAAPHFKHGLAALILGLAVLIVAWFLSGPKRR